jgi:hypothetical protein
LTDAPSLEIAAVRFTVSLPAGSRLASNDPPHYGPFLQATRSTPERIDVSARLVLGGAPDTGQLPSLFDTGSSWRAFRDGEDLVLELTLPDIGVSPLWLARVPPGAQEITIHCGPPLVLRESDPVTIRSPLSYPLDELLMMHILPARAGLLVHAAGVRRGETAVVFPGRSGAGKSTLMRGLKGGADLEGLSDDRIVIRKVDSSFKAYGTPWAGTEGVAANASARLGAIVFLHQAPRCRLQRIDARDTLRQLLPTASVLWYDPDRVEQSLAFCDELTSRIPAYDLQFEPGQAVRDVLSDLL